MTSRLLLLSCVLHFTLGSQSTPNIEKLEENNDENIIQVYWDDIDDMERLVNVLIPGSSTEKCLKRNQVMQTVSQVVSDLRNKFPTERDFLKIKNLENTEISGRFIATGGYFRDLKSLGVHGEVEFVDTTATNPSKVIVPMKFRTFEAGFRTYSLVLPQMSHTGSVEISVGSHKLKMILEINYEPYSLLLLDLVFEEIDDIKVSLIGLDKKYTKIKKILTNWIVENFKKDFQQAIVNELKHYLIPIFPKY